MLTRAELLEPLAAGRTDEVVVTTMSVVRPWGRLSDSDLDFASADSAMAHAADLALGIAMARPDRRVLCLNGDGSMLMSLGTLATIVSSGVENLALVVVENGTYEITGNQPVAAAGRCDYAAMARAAGFRRAWSIEEPEDWRQRAPDLLRGRGPLLAAVRVAAGNEGPISRSDQEQARYLQVSLHDWSRVLRRALRASPPTTELGGAASP